VARPKRVKVGRLHYLRPNRQAERGNASDVAHAEKWSNYEAISAVTADRSRLDAMDDTDKFGRARAKFRESHHIFLH
jgi:hypothetical protein